MADLVFDGAREYIGDGTIDLDDDDLRMMLLADTYTPDQTDDVYADISAHEIASASGYTTKGMLLSNVTWTRAGAVVTLDSDDIQWTSFSATCRYAVLYSDTPTSPADPLIFLFDLGENKTGQGGNFKLVVHANGLGTIN